jgi:RND family efflux transporter MFP subunit
MADLRRLAVALRRRWGLTALALAVLAGAGYALWRGGAMDGRLTYQVTRCDFLITQVETGEVQASRGEQVSSPRIGGRLKIIHLWPEGARVDVGDLVIQFDPATFEKEMEDEEGQLLRAKADYEKVQAEQQQRRAEYERQIEQQQAQLELAKLNLQRSAFGSPIDQQRAQIELAKAERALAQARENLTAQLVVQRVELGKFEMQIARRQQRYDRARENYDKTRIVATKPGIVVYRKVWKPGTEGESKILVGDVVHGGQALMDIPDLSAMQVLCLVGEVDLKRMQVGQKASVRLDAFPGPVFHGEVGRLAPMATPQPGAPDIRVFEMLVDISEEDERLKPGMSAEVEVVLEAVPQTLSVPLAAVFEQDGKPVVYRRRGRSFVPTPVELGQTNRTAAVVVSGLQEGDAIALKEPIRP